MKFVTIGVLAALILAAGCSGSSSAPPSPAAPGGGADIARSAFRDAGPDGKVSLPPSTAPGAQSTATNTGFYGFAIRTTTDGGIDAVANSLTVTNPRILPTAGTARIDATYRLAGIPDGRRSRDIEEVEGEIDLRANFGTATLRGNDGTLDLDLAFGPRGALRGTAEWEGLSGPVRGWLSSGDVFGSFHGNDDSGAFAGGFQGNR